MYKSTLLESCVVSATDVELGKVKDLYFDSEKWTIRYLVVDTSKWLPGRKVAIEPQTIALIDWANKEILTNLTSNAAEKKRVILL